MKNRQKTSIKDVNDNCLKKTDNKIDPKKNEPKKSDVVKKKTTPNKKTTPSKSDQQTLSQFGFKSNVKSKFQLNLPTVESVFQPKRVEAIKTIPRTIPQSPNLFSTQMDATPKPPDKLYEFASGSSSSGSFSSHKGANITHETITKNSSPFLEVTPIKQKIEVQRSTEQSTGGFVCASKVFNVQSHPKEPKKSNQVQNLRIIEDEYSDFPLDDGLDDVFMDMIYEEANLGLENTKWPSNKASNDVTAKILNHNGNSSRVPSVMNESIKRDFDDCNDDKQESQHPQENLAFWNEFFTDDDLVNERTTKNNEKSTTTKPVASRVLEPVREVQRSVLPSRSSVLDFQQPKAALQQKAPQMHTLDSDSRSQASSSSIQATFGSTDWEADDWGMDDWEPLPKVRKLSPKRVSIDKYAFTPKPQMQTRASPENFIQRKRRFMEIDPSTDDQTEGKKPKKSLMELVADVERKKNENDESLKRQK